LTGLFGWFLFKGMKTLIKTLFLIFAVSSFAQTNILILTWVQPPGYQSTLYESQNLGTGWQNWTNLGSVAPPFSVTPTNQTAFFYVVVAPTNAVSDYVNYAGPPTNNPPALQHIVVDSNGRQWQFYQSGWH
jgi:hypothetical protein